MSLLIISEATNCTHKGIQSKYGRYTSIINSYLAIIRLYNTEIAKNMMSYIKNTCRTVWGEDKYKRASFIYPWWELSISLGRNSPKRQKENYKLSTFF